MRKYRGFDNDLFKLINQTQHIEWNFELEKDDFKSWLKCLNKIISELISELEA